MLKRKGDSTFLTRIRKDILRVQNETNGRYRSLLKSVARDLVVFTPQWSGNLVSNWNLETSTARATYKVSSKKGSFIPGTQVYQMGSEPGVSKTLGELYRQIDSITYRDNARFINTTPYASEVEAGIGPGNSALREVNYNPYMNAVSMVGYVQMKYKNQAEIKKASLAWLRM